MQSTIELHDFPNCSDIDENTAVERTAKSFPTRRPMDNPFRYGFKHEVLKVSAEGNKLVRFLREIKRFFD